MTERGTLKLDRSSRRRIGRILSSTALILALIGGGLGSAEADGFQKSQADGDEPIGFPLPKLEIVEKQFEWERCLQGEIVTHRFKVRNVGNAPLKILRVRANCGCTTPSFSDQIAVGKEGYIELMVNTGETPGGFVRKNATVFSNDPTQEDLTLFIQGQVDPILKVSDGPLKLSGVYTETKLAKFELLPGTEQVTTVLSGKAEKDQMEIVSIDPREGGGCIVTVRAPRNKSPQLLRDSLIFQVQLDDGPPVDAMLPVTIAHLDTMQMTPSGNIVFYRRQTAHLERNPDREITRELSLRATRIDLPLHVKSARIEGAPEGLFSTEVKTVTPGQHYIIKIRVLRTENQSQVQGQLVIETEDPLTPIRKKDVFAQFRMRPPQGQ